MVQNDITLSICIPTYRERKLIVNLVQEVLKQIDELISEEVELIVSVNPSEERVDTELQKFLINDAFKLFVNETNIGAVNNTLNAVEHASGRYVWIFGDDDFIVPGTIKRVIDVVKEHEDVAWIHLNAATLNGDASDDNAKLMEGYVKKIVDRGYFVDGKKEFLKLFREIDGRILFSTSNVFLRQCLIDVKRKEYAKLTKSLHDIFFQLTGIFHSANLGAAYIIPDVCIIAGGVVTWSDTAYYVAVHGFNDAILAASDWGYSIDEVKNLVRYRMSHEALMVWVLILKKMLKKPTAGFADFYKYFKIMPIFAVFILFGWVIWIPYLGLRHWYRNKQRQKSLDELRSKENLPDCIKRRL